MFAKLLMVIVLGISGLLLFAAFKSPNMEISRQISIKSTPEKLFPYLNNSQKANEWMPWVDSDPEMKMIYSGPSEGVGSIASWNSAGQMGTGSAEVIESIPNQSVKTKLEYTKPMTMSQVATISLTDEANGEVVVRWTINSHNPFLFRLMGVFMNCDKMIGGEFEKGLAKLKATSELEK